MDTTAAEATGHDVPQILAVLAEAFTPFGVAFTPTALRLDEGTVRRELRHWLVARSGGAVVGCVLQYPEDQRPGDGSYTFCFLATRPHLRGRGIGSALVEEVGERARRAGCRRVLVAVRRTLPENVGFFTRRGFRYLEPFGTGPHDLYQHDLCRPGRQQLEAEAKPWKP
ncbi:GNAT family N-acetyltransferase [Kitasatospora sp. NPDC056138]|uniref:GNAT family N-acetyltransferase n=1 Tax=Kitasatospora sp. NPDC056138 TaxID=3345724 RepID=UPI0035DD2BDA